MGKKKITLLKREMRGRSRVPWRRGLRSPSGGVGTAVGAAWAREGDEVGAHRHFQ